MNCLLDASVQETVAHATYLPCEYLVRQAIHDCEIREAMALRRAVFCIEQGIFLQDDRDAVDTQAQLLVALACEAGIAGQVVGTPFASTRPRRACGGARGWPCIRPFAAWASWGPR